MIIGYWSASHLAPLFDNPKLDRELRSMLRERFPEFCSSPSPPTEGDTTTHPHTQHLTVPTDHMTSVSFTVKMEEAVSLEMDNHILDKEEGCYDNTEATFSDDEEEINNKGDNNQIYEQCNWKRKCTCIHAQIGRSKLLINAYIRNSYS